MPRPRLVRRQTLYQRISAAINPLDFLLWLSEEIETRELDCTATGAQVGVVANFVFLLARANMGPSANADDDVFGDGSGQGWISYLVQLFVWTGVTLSVANTIFVFTRKRHYRLFEANIDKGPATPSAQRVKVQSSPSSASPFRFLSDLAGFDSAESRAHPDETRDVWELAIWDPRPASLELLSFFSPLHVLIYIFELPLDPLEPHPSVTVFKCLTLQIGLSALMKLVQSNNDQRQRDNAIVQKEVFHEYDTKFVQPRLHPIVRDVATQVSVNDIFGADSSTSSKGLVESGPPTTLIRRAFQTHPNPHYMKHIDPDYGRPSSSARQSSSFQTPRLVTPANKPSRYSDSYTQSSALQSRHSMAPSSVVTPGYATAAGTPATVASSSASTVHAPATVGSTGTSTTDFGGHLGVRSHVNSPLKKATSMNDIGGSSGFFSPRNSRELAALEQREAVEQIQRRASPIKEETATPGGRSRHSFHPKDPSSPAAVNPFLKARSSAYKYERFPSRR